MKILFVPRVGGDRNPVQKFNRELFDNIFLETLANVANSEGTSRLFTVKSTGYKKYHPDAIIEILEEEKPDILLLERDIMLCQRGKSYNCKGDINYLLGYLEDNVPMVVSEPELLILCSYKQYYSLPEFERFILPGTKIINSPSMIDDRFDFDTYPVYIAKLPHTSANRGIFSDISASNQAEKISNINLVLNKWMLDDVIIQPQLTDMSEFRVIYIGDKIFDIIATESFGVINELGQLPMSMIQYNSCTSDIRKTYIDDDIDKSILEDDDEFNEYCKRLSTRYGTNASEIICHFELYYRHHMKDVATFSNSVFNQLVEYIGKVPVYCRIDVILDQQTGNFYLNEIEPYSSGKYNTESILCDFIDKKKHDINPLNPDIRYNYFQYFAEFFCEELLRRIS